ncbi:MAG: carbon-nitrogen hydrolase family protein [Candidatus Hodarchaeota archaeon]
MKVALAQLDCIQGNPTSNLNRAIPMMKAAQQADCDLIVFPEMFLTGFISKDQLLELAEPLDGPSILKLCTLAKNHDLGIIMGLPEMDPRTKKVYNTALAIEPDGTVAGFHRKVHPFGRESELHATGTTFEPFQFLNHKIGLVICFDTEFPESARLLALKGAEVVFAPTANMKPYERVQSVFVRARALENHIFYAICNRVGSDNIFTYFGESTVADPFGNLLCRAGNSEEIVYAELDFSLISKSKQTYDYLKERRPDAYKFQIG